MLFTQTLAAVEVGSSTGIATAVFRFKGIAPNVKFINLRVLDGNGQGQDSYIIAAIQRAISLYTKAM